jgi:hypothetical protein
LLGNRNEGERGSEVHRKVGRKEGKKERRKEGKKEGKRIGRKIMGRFKTLVLSSSEYLMLY